MMFLHSMLHSRTRLPSLLQLRFNLVLNLALSKHNNKLLLHNLPRLKLQPLTQACQSLLQWVYSMNFWEAKLLELEEQEEILKIFWTLLLNSTLKISKWIQVSLILTSMTPSQLMLMESQTWPKWLLLSNLPGRELRMKESKKKERLMVGEQMLSQRDQFWMLMENLTSQKWH